MPEAFTATPRTTVKRLPERARYDRRLVHAVLDEALICHVGFVVDGAPRVIPTIHARPPVDDEEDLDFPVWAGLIPLRTTAGPTEDDPLVRGTAPSPVITAWHRPAPGR
jgi:hypothetical protein